MDVATDPNNIVKAITGTRGSGVPANIPAGGGFGGVPSTLPGNGVSPTIASYDAWSSGRGQSSGLAREWATFLSGSFGPLAPMRPVAIDAPDPETGQPDPRKWIYPVGWNMPMGPPGSEGLKLASFAQLRTLADTYSVARACIDLRKQEIVGLEWDIVPTKAAEKRMRNHPAMRREWDQRRAKVMKFFRRPDSDYFGFANWFNAQIEDVLAVDAWTLYPWPAKRHGGGVMGSDLGELTTIDGTTMRPLVSINGGKPRAPNVAYQQFAYGVPRVDLATLIAGTDIDGMKDAKVGDYTANQVFYLPYDTRTWTPYGMAPIEKALVPILSGLNRQQWQLEYFSEGTVPGLFVSAGDPNMTPTQIRELQAALNALAGDPAWKHKIIVLPGGSKTDPMRPTELAGVFDEMIITQTCMGFGVMPMELGLTPRSSTSGNSGGAVNQMGKMSTDAQNRKANRPLLHRFMEVYDYVIQVTFHQDDMRFLFEGLEETEDEQTAVNIMVNEISHGLSSIDEGRIARGKQPWGLPITSDPVMMTPTGIIPIGGLDPETGQLPAPPTPVAPGAPEGPAPGAAPGAPRSAPAGGGAPATPAHAGAHAAEGGKSATADLVKVGPHGYIHGWIHVGPASVGDVVHHDTHGEGVVTGVHDDHVRVRFAGGEHDIPRTLYQGMHPASAEEKTAFRERFAKAIPPAWSDVHIADDLDTAKLLVKGKDAKGRTQSVYSAAHTEGQAAAKFERIKQLVPHLDKLDHALERDAGHDDSAAALLLIRRLGMRPGSEKATGAEKHAHGATNLRAGHATVDGTTTTLDFTGKKGVHIRLTTDDPLIASVIGERLKSRHGDDRLFDTDEAKTRAYMRSTGVPAGFLLKDLRTLRANVVALREIKARGDAKPKTKAEFLRWRRQVASVVSAQLGNTPTLALSSYINPSVFSDWLGGDWL